MNCSACNKNLPATLSVCPSCGTMVDDSVREELASKISPIVRPIKKLVEEKPVHETFTELPKSDFPIKEPVVNSVQVAEPREICLPTKEIPAKQTGPILVEFQNKNAVVPEWRLQLQNSIRRRNGGNAETAPTAPQRVLATAGAVALKAEIIEHPVVIASGNEKLENALKRIEQSRQKYLVEQKPPVFTTPVQPSNFSSVAPNKSKTFPLSKIHDSDRATPKPSFTFNAGKFEKFDTNKLPSLPPKVITTFENPIEISSDETKLEEKKNNILHIKADETPEVLAYTETTVEEFDKNVEIAETENEGDDRAPMLMRFNAGFFDLIIGAVMSFILLAPFTLTNGNLFTFQGLLAFLATCAIVMFIYLTATIGTMGRTFGMKIFSLEIVDIEANEYPTFHQAAVSSSVYLASLALGGIGFLTLFLNDENRAAHDLISGTIVLKEYE